MAAPAILGRQVALLYRNAQLGQAISIVNASLLAWLWHDRVGPAMAGGWWLAAALTGLIRLHYARVFQRIPGTASAEVLAGWLRRTRLGAGTAGLVWGAGALVFMIGAETVQEIFTAFVMAGMVAGAVSVLAPDKVAFRLYAFPIVLATAVAALGTDPLHLTIVAMALVFLGVSMRSVDNFNQTLLESLRLEQEKDALVGKVANALAVAEKSSRAKSEFLANVSHELRTPLHGIQGMAELLSTEEISPTQRQWLATLRGSADELLSLINSLIELATLEAGHSELRPSPFALAELLAAFLDAPKKMAEAKGLALEYWMDVSLPPIVVGDVERLRRILRHLTDNAVKFTEQGTIRVTAQLQAATSDTVHIEFVVSDTGIGIPPEKLESIFQPFTPGDASSTRRHAGVGIGLPICRRLAELMQGSLKVESQPGKGSTFRLSLPFGLTRD